VTEKMEEEVRSENCKIGPKGDSESSMNKDSSHVILIDASPKVSEKSVSEWFSDYCRDYWKNESFTVEQINVRKSIKNADLTEVYKRMEKADAYVIIFPLYFFCMPGILTRFLQDYVCFFLEHSEPVRQKKKVYAVVNCGFPEPENNEEAIHVIKSFSEKIQAEFGFGISLGAGPMIYGAKDAPFMKKVFHNIEEALTMIKEDILAGERKPEQQTLKNVYLTANFPRKLYLSFGSKGWIKTAKANQLEKGELYKRPYSK